MKDVYGPVNRATLRRAVIDFTLALALFWLSAFALSSHNGKAHAVPLNTPSAVAQARPEPVSRPVLFNLEARAPRQSGPSQTEALALLGVAFALLVSLNLAIWRHLRRAYASTLFTMLL
jgi:hypothetical protein